jgi:hypothetical protein
VAAASAFKMSIPGTARVIQESHRSNTDLQRAIIRRKSFICDEHIRLGIRETSVGSSGATEAREHMLNKRHDHQVEATKRCLKVMVNNLLSGMQVSSGKKYE